MILFTGFLKPVGRLGVVLGHTLAQITHNTQIVLSTAVCVFCGAFEPLGGFFEVLVDADTLIEK